MAGRKRDVQLHFMVNEKEKELITNRMDEFGISNMGAFLRKMAIDGYVIHLDLQEVHEMLSLLRRCSNNLNQLTKRVHEIGNLYASDLEDLLRQFDEIWTVARDILSELNKI